MSVLYIPTHIEHHTFGERHTRVLFVCTVCMPVSSRACTQAHACAFSIWLDKFARSFSRFFCASAALARMLLKLEWSGKGDDKPRAAATAAACCCRRVKMLHAFAVYLCFALSLFLLFCGVCEIIRVRRPTFSFVSRASQKWEWCTRWIFA